MWYKGYDIWNFQFFAWIFIVLHPQSFSFPGKDIKGYVMLKGYIWSALSMFLQMEKGILSDALKTVGS